MHPALGDYAHLNQESPAVAALLTKDSLTKMEPELVALHYQWANLVRLQELYAFMPSWVDSQLLVVLGMDCLVPTTPAPILKALLKDPEVDNLECGMFLTDHTYIHLRAIGQQDSPHRDQDMTLDFPRHLLCLILMGSQQRCRLLYQGLCTRAELSSLLASHGTTMGVGRGDRSLDVSKGLDPIQQIRVRLNEFGNRLCYIQAVVPLPKGPLLG